MTRKGLYSKSKNNLERIKESVEFEKRYGTLRTFGKAVDKEQKARDKVRINKILKERYS